MSAILALLREDLRDFEGYRSARSEAGQGLHWLNANESPRANACDQGARLRRYPEPQPETLRSALASVYGCHPNQLLLGRGSDEPIDLLVRTLCRPGLDAVLVTPPVFGMYAASARLQGAPLLEVPLRDDGGEFSVDFDAVTDTAQAHSARLVFLCSPGNPAGAPVAADDVLALAGALRGHALVVVDEAYVEFADTPSLIERIGRCDNLAVLRTLSKAHALAAARIGSLVAHPDLVERLRRYQAPYPIAEPSARHALAALQPMALAATGLGVAMVRRERERLRRALATLPAVRHAYPSQGNFLLVRFVDVDDAWRRLLRAGIVVRDMRAMPQLGDALRISIGTPEQNDRVLAAVAGRSGP